MNIFMISPAVVATLEVLKDHTSLGGALALMLIMNGLPVLFRAKLVDLEKDLLKGIREKANRISTDRYDQEESVKDENRKIRNGLASDEGAIAGPYMITACTAGIYCFFTLAMPRVNNSHIFWWGVIATAIVCYHANKLGNAQDKVRGELRELLPHVAPEEQSQAIVGSEVMQDNGNNLNTQDNRTFIRVAEDVKAPVALQVAVVLRNGTVIEEKTAGR